MDFLLVVTAEALAQLFPTKLPFANREQRADALVLCFPQNPEAFASIFPKTKNHANWRGYLLVVTAEGFKPFFTSPLFIGLS